MTLLFTCLKIFFARILDVCISTIRTTFVLRGSTIIVAILAFFEVTIWFLVARTALNTELNLFIILSYSGGYTTGTVLGTIITNKFIKTNVEIMIISTKIKTTKKIKEKNFGATIINKDNNKTILIIETNKKRLEELKELINYLDKNAFITIKETRTTINGYI